MRLNLKNSKSIFKINIVKRACVYLIASLITIGLITLFFTINRTKISQSSPDILDQTELNILVGAPGRVEPISEEIEVSSEISGKLESVLVEEGDQVQRGQVIAILANEEYRAQVALMKARLDLKNAELRLIISGARSQERREAWELVKEADVVMKNSRIELERRQQLYQEGIIAREEADRAEREYKVCKARYEAAKQHFKLIDDEAREEDRSKAEAEVAMAQAQLEEARARFKKTFIRSPITGVILRKYLKTGETVSSSFSSKPIPIVTVANITTLRVRVDLDESDIGKVKIGQKAYVTADAYGNKKFWCHVVRIGQILGKKNIYTDEPTERVDKKILEVLIEVDDICELHPGLRVDAFIITKDTPLSTIDSPFSKN